MSRLPNLHAERVAKEALAHEAEVAILHAAHEAECDIVNKMNANIQRWVLHCTSSPAVRLEVTHGFPVSVRGSVPDTCMSSPL